MVARFELIIIVRNPDLLFNSDSDEQRPKSYVSP